MIFQYISINIISSHHIDITSSFHPKAEVLFLKCIFTFQITQSIKLFENYDFFIRYDEDSLRNIESYAMMLLRDAVINKILSWAWFESTERAAAFRSVSSERISTVRWRLKYEKEFPSCNQQLIFDADIRI